MCGSHAGPACRSLLHLKRLGVTHTTAGFLISNAYCKVGGGVRRLVRNSSMPYQANLLARCCVQPSPHVSMRWSWLPTGTRSWSPERLLIRYYVFYTQAAILLWTACLSCFASFRLHVQRLATITDPNECKTNHQGRRRMPGTVRGDSDRR